MNDLTLNIRGFAAVTRDLKVQVLDPVTRNVVREVRPFLDGTVRVPQIPAGNYEIQVLHPNLSLPVLVRPVHVLPIGPTAVTVMIDPSKFHNTPIEDIPEANLAPVADLARSIAETVTPLATKGPGEAIRSSDWNALAGAVRDVSNTTGELTRLVSPVGHNHPELEAKIHEMEANFQALLDSMSQALAELQRQDQALRLRTQVMAALLEAKVAPSSATGKKFIALLDALDGKINATPAVFSRETRNVAVQLEGFLNDLIDEKSAATPDLAASDPIRKFTDAIAVFKGAQATNYLSELHFNRRVDRSIPIASRIRE